ncbi:hypothetical protein LL06_13865 [Hoeflea sp. BAL378]|nr:hypothetical protein LL06_13865 [Hoeflea sp. BAL378]
MKILDKIQGGHSEALGEEDFIKTFGKPPWEHLSEALQSMSLPYEIVPPPMNGFDDFDIKFRRLDNKEVVPFSHLSSGEKVLVQLTLSSLRFEITNTFVRLIRPKILLLDEMDASLHPEMVHRWLRAIRSSLVEEQGIECILTTHSPTTVALAPEEALYELRDGASGLIKISKQEALNRLTFGVPTLSISFSGRRQVFTESDTDAQTYERVYSRIKSRLDCYRELNFLSTGMRDKDGGEINSGCKVVSKIVRGLVDNGNLSVFGIVDWDGKAKSLGRVKVLAEDKRDGIENLLLDPLLVCLLLMKDRNAPEEVRDISSFAGAASLCAEDIQRLVDSVQNAVVKNRNGKKVRVRYLGDRSAEVYEQYLVMDDHDLEAALKEKIPAVQKRASGGRGKLIENIVEHVLSEHIEFCPIEFKEIFEEIANCVVE